MVVIRVASVFVDGPFLFSTEDAAEWGRQYRYMRVIFWVEVRV